jgi:endonuclease YncB( thermonuclease family)
MQKFAVKSLSVALGVTLLMAPQGKAASKNTKDSQMLLRPMFSEGLVESVVTADTLVLEEGDAVKLIGVKALKKPPRERNTIKRDKYGFIIKEPVDPATTLEKRALEFAKRLLENKKVRIEFDKQKTNENFDTLAYVFLEDGTLVNAEVLRQGYGRLQIRPPNSKYEQELREAYQEARREKRGLHSN